MHASVFLAAVYGGYFGAGLGIMLLAALGAFLPDDMQRLNALKGLLSLVISAVAVVYFALFGPVAWAAAAVMAVASLAGGQLGVRVAKRLSAAALRWVVVVFGTASRRPARDLSLRAARSGMQSPGISPKRRRRDQW